MQSDNGAIIENSISRKEADIAEALAAKTSLKRAGLFFLLLMLFEIPMAIGVHIVQGKFPPDYSVLVSLLMTQGYLLLGAVIYILLTKKSLSSDLRLRTFNLTDFFLTILVLIVASPMASLLNIASQFFAKNKTSTAIFSVTEQVPMWLGILIIGCMPGFIEELLYRGIMLAEFRKKSILTGVVVSGISFGLMHMNFNQIMYAINLGTLFALIVEATDSLLSTMILHMIFNAVNTSWLYILPRLYEWLGNYYESYKNFDINEAMNAEVTNSQLLAMFILIFPFAAGGIVLTWLLIKYIAKRNGRQLSWRFFTGCSNEKREIKPVTVCLVLGWVICLAFAIAELF